MSNNLTFHYFPNLPTEIRLRIWSLALSNSRIIHIDCERGVHPTLRRYAKAFTSPDPGPPLLHVNHEARREALRVYRASFRTRHVPDHCIYIAFDRDVLQLSENVLAYVEHAELNAIQTMIVEVIDSSYFACFCMDILRQMLKLRELKLVMARKNNENSSQVQLAQYIATIKEDFNEVIKLHPEWEFPNVTIITHDTGEEVGVVVAGRALRR